MKKGSRFYRFLRFLFGPLITFLYRVKFINKKNIPEKGAYILASNHVSGMDPIYIIIGQKRQIFFMTKAELFNNKLLGGFLRLMGCFPVARGRSDKSSIKHFEQILQSGNLMGIFIEGTRSKDGEFLQPKNGVSLIAYNSKTPVIPVCITKKGFFKIVHFGQSLSLDDMGLKTGSSKELREATRIIMDNIKSLREQDLN